MGNNVSLDTIALIAARLVPHVTNLMSQMRGEKEKGVKKAVVIARLIAKEVEETDGF